MRSVSGYLWYYQILQQREQTTELFKSTLYILVIHGSRKSARLQRHRLPFHGHWAGSAALRAALTAGQPHTQAAPPGLTWRWSATAGGRTQPGVAQAVAQPLWLPVVLGRQVSSRVFLQPKCHPPVTNYLRQTQNVFLHRNYAIIPSLLALCWIALLCDFLLAVTGICLKWKKGRVCTKDPRHFMRSQFPLR